MWIYFNWTLGFDEEKSEDGGDELGEESKEHHLKSSGDENHQPHKLKVLEEKSHQQNRWTTRQSK